jgi:hypothetical protein
MQSLAESSEEVACMGTDLGLGEEKDEQSMHAMQLSAHTAEHNNKNLTHS